MSSLRKANRRNDRHDGKFVAFLRFFSYSRRALRLMHASEAGRARNNSLVFGSDLTHHLASSGNEVPLVLTCCSDFIERCAIVDGIYRLSGVISNIERLRQAFDEDRIPNFGDNAIIQDVHCVASLLKLYFRELPDPLLTYKLYDKFIQAFQPNYPNEVTIASEAVVSEEAKVSNLKDVIRQMPPSHYNTLKYLLKHLSTVASHGASTGMTAKNVAIVWAPNLLRCQDLDAQSGVAALQLISIQAVITEYLIKYADELFEPPEVAIEEPDDSLGSVDSHEPSNPASHRDGVRPKSVPSACSHSSLQSQSRLISVEEAQRTRSRLNSTEHCSGKKFIEVGSGPDNMPPKYHTIIETSLCKGKGTDSRRVRKSPSADGVIFHFLRRPIYRNSFEVPLPLAHTEELEIR